MKEKKKTIRIDRLLVDREFCSSIEEARACLMAGEVYGPNGQRLEKPSIVVDPNALIEMRSRTGKFSSRGGHKLEHALDTFGVSVVDMVGMDIGASTGGFTDCLLKRGAKHVFAVDVGYGLLDQKLRLDPRVTNLEKTNARFLKCAELQTEYPLILETQLISIDVSFISLRKVIEPMAGQFSKKVKWLLLFKPQFEVAPKYLSKGGVVKDASAVEKALEDFQAWMVSQGFRLLSTPVASPLPGKKSGNIEYLLYYDRDENEPIFI